MSKLFSRVIYSCSTPLPTEKSIFCLCQHCFLYYYLFNFFYNFLWRMTVLFCAFLQRDYKAAAICFILKKNNKMVHSWFHSHGSAVNKMETFCRTLACVPRIQSIKIRTTESENILGGWCSKGTITVDFCKSLTIPILQQVRIQYGSWNFQWLQTLRYCWRTIIFQI